MIELRPRGLLRRTGLLGTGRHRSNRPGGLLRRTGPILGLAVGLATSPTAVPPALAQFAPPDAAWRTLETTHFRVTFPDGLEGLAMHAAQRAEAAHARLSDALGRAPGGTIDLVLTDHVDFSNGVATVFPSNRIYLFARPPAEHLALGYHDDWIDFLVVHELTHLFHMDRRGRLDPFPVRVFGRPPLGWPFFPVVGTPRWSLEGLATFYESHHTGAGRVHGSFHEMIVRTAVLEDRFESIDRIEAFAPDWPDANRPYVYGSLFFAYLADRYGEEVHRALVDATADAWIPPPLAFDRVARRATGRSFTSLYAEWRDTLAVKYAALADSVAVRGLTSYERITGDERFALHARVAPDGRSIAFARDDGRRDPATAVLDPETGDVRHLARRSQFGQLFGPASWMPDGRALVTAQLEQAGPHRTFQDLYRLDPGGREHRLTRGMRLAHPDVSPDGRSVVAIQEGGGTNRVVIYDLASGMIGPLTDAVPERYWSLPRWAPDGRRIAAGRWERGGYHDVVVLDTAGRILFEPPRDRAMSGSPAWSPDGRYLLFWSDRTGIPDLYAWDLDASPVLRQVTRVLTGAFHPEVSRDGAWIYFSVYHADGFSLARVPFDPAAWFEPSPLRPDLVAGEAVRAGASPVGPDAAGSEQARAGAPPEGAGASPEGAGAGATAPRAYSPLRTVLPRFWLPTLDTRGALGTFVGAYTRGNDAVGRHVYSARGALNTDGRLQGRVDYSYAGFGNPVLDAYALRSWSTGRIEDGRWFSAEDRFAVTATLMRSRWRSGAVLVAGPEYQRVTISAEDYDGPPFRNFDRIGGMVGLGFSNTRRYPFSISHERGISISLTGRHAADLRPLTLPNGRVLDESYNEGSARILAFAPLPRWMPGAAFAGPVLAFRTTSIRRDGPGAWPVGIGGAPGSVLDLGSLDWTGGSVARPVRGFAESTTGGTRAWAASLEYRYPLALIGAGHRLWPVFLDRAAGALFVDAGSAWCTDAQRAARYPNCPAFTPVTLVGAGAELALDVSFLFAVPLRLRGGFGYPFRGPGDRPVGYFRIGPAF